MQTTERSVIETHYQEDYLGTGFEQVSLHHPYDYEGKVLSTLIRKKSPSDSGKAVLYVHGFNDYFFQAEMADWWVARNWNFYAIDLRKYGRSWRPHQKLNNVRHLKEYYQDLSKALEQIHQEDNTHVVLSGHSTGGLITALYAHDHPENRYFQALFLNSPFFDFNLDPLTKNLGIPFLSFLGKRWPDVRMKGGFSKYYGHSLHVSEKGEWDYNLKWKPHVAPNVNVGFIRAIREGHLRVKRGLKIDVPVLVMHSEKSYHGRKWSDRFFSCDTILNVKNIHHEAEKIEGVIQLESIPGGMHDLVLSPKKARSLVYTRLDDWLSSIQNNLLF